MGNNTSAHDKVVERLTGLSEVLFNDSRCKTADVQTILKIDRLKTFIALCKYEMKSADSTVGTGVITLLDKIDSELATIFSGVEMSSSDVTGEGKSPKNHVDKNADRKSKKDRPKVAEIHKNKDEEEWGSNMKSEDSDGDDLQGGEDRDVKEDPVNSRSNAKIKVKIQAPGDVSITPGSNKDYVSAIGSSLAPIKSKHAHKNDD